MCGVITTIMDQKIQLLNALNKRELNTTWHSKSIEKPLILTKLFIILSIPAFRCYPKL
jgi:hypothetical protein